MVYRFYVNAADALDKLSAVYGSDSSPLVINTPAGIYNAPAAAGPSAEGLSDFLLGFFPEIADDSYATVNLIDRRSCIFWHCWSYGTSSH